MLMIGVASVLVHMFVVGAVSVVVGTVTGLVVGVASIEVVVVLGCYLQMRYQNPLTSPVLSQTVF